MQRKISAEEKAKVALVAMQGNLTRSRDFIEVLCSYDSNQSVEEASTSWFGGYIFEWEGAERIGL